MTVLYKKLRPVEAGSSSGILVYPVIYYITLCITWYITVLYNMVYNSGTIYNGYKACNVS